MCTSAGVLGSGESSRVGGFARHHLIEGALELADDEERVNPNGGAIALGHPLGMSGTRLVLTALEELQLRGERYALCTMCIGVGQGISILLERV